MPTLAVLVGRCTESPKGLCLGWAEPARAVGGAGLGARTSLPLRAVHLPRRTRPVG